MPTTTRKWLLDSFCLVILKVGDGGGLSPRGWDFWDEARVVGATEELF